MLVLIWMILSALTWRWTAINTLMDGYQNEYLHVGNALDLWEAWRARDSYNLGYLLSSNYWPPLFYLWPSLLFALFGVSYMAMVLSNPH